MDLYDVIIDGFKRNIPAGTEIGRYLQSLQLSVKALRIAYRNTPVVVPYEKTDTQAAYLVTYLPHYYLLIYNILLEKAPEIFQDEENVYLTFIGGGPGSEAYGAIKYLVNNNPGVKNVHITILDINASTWGFSHKIVLDSLIKPLTESKMNIHWQARYFDLVSPAEIQEVSDIIKKSHLLVIQNCLNEITARNSTVLKNNIKQLFEYLPASSYLLLSDLTSGARSILKVVEEYLVDSFTPRFLQSTLSFPDSVSIISVHARPSSLLSEHLLTGANGLIPRKYIKYDYSLLSKGVIEAKQDNAALGFNAIYRPLDFKKLDANDYAHKKTFIGIDFGTSSTVISTAQLADGKIKIKSIPIKQKDHSGNITSSPLVPTVISIVEGEGKGKRIIVGKHAALNKPYLEYGKNSWYAFKQNLGRLETITYPDSDLKAHPKYKISNAQEALTFFFRFIKDQIFEYIKDHDLPDEVAYSISVPAGFPSREKQMLKACLIKAGIECEDVPFMEEPNAALINYLFEQNTSVDGENPAHFLVLDLGAGTVDVSIISIENSAEGFSSKLLSVVRLGNIGGNLVDEVIAGMIIQRSGSTIPEDPTYLPGLLSLCEKLKIKMCKEVITDAAVGYVLPAMSHSARAVALEVPSRMQVMGLKTMELTFKEFNKIMSDYWEGDALHSGVKGTIDKAIENASLDPASIDKIIVTGGGGRNPYIKNMVASYFTASKLFISDNIQEQVSRGVALQSFVLNSFGKNILTPILGYDIRLKVARKVLLLFDNGITLPSNDVELETSILTAGGTLVCYSEDNRDFKKSFTIPPNLKVTKLIFYITPDQELRCTILGKDFEIEINQNL